ncbi:unnamed protein product [Medioppia subpectinata]|uniref:SCP2 domain-containing protein n=1 Tax=Medioppia subpectinata TaxID=1979941 RepID=A0A7R9L270_9ACAR|nr:unnamed protein product [Medioppia subpectinata]CAG2114191.1 unnamed protein product [Medioppia subpectinata]
MGQKMKIQGNLMAAHKFQQFWAEEALHGSLRHLNERLALGAGSDGNSGSAGGGSGGGGGQREEALLASIPVDGLKSDIVFNTIRTRLSEEPDLVKAMRFVIQFNITRNGKVVAVWTTDTKVDGGEVYRSAPKVKPDAIVNVDDENYVRILFGQLNPQRAFMTGKISVKGNILLLQKLDSFWNQVQGQRKDPEMPQVKDIMLKDPMKPGLKSEVIIFDLIQKLVRLPNLLSEGSTVRFDIKKDGQLASKWSSTVRFDIKKDGQLASKWKLSFPSGANGLGRIERADNTSGADDNTLTVDDNDFVRLTYSTLKLEDAIASGRVKYSGDPSSVAKLSKMFNTSIIKAKL